MNGPALKLPSNVVRTHIVPNPPSARAENRKTHAIYFGIGAAMAAVSYLQLFDVINLIFLTGFGVGASSPAFRRALLNMGLSALGSMAFMIVGMVGRILFQVISKGNFVTKNLFIVPKMASIGLTLIGVAYAIWVFAVPIGYGARKLFLYFRK